MDAGNQSGPMCRLCDPPTDTSLGGYFDEDAGRCKECPVPSNQIGTIAAIIAGILCALAFVAWVFYRPPPPLRRTSAAWR